MFMTSPPAVALRQEENRTASQQSKLFILNKLTAGTFQAKGFSLVLTVELLSDDRRTLTELKNKKISNVWWKRGF